MEFQERNLEEGYVHGAIKCSSLQMIFMQFNQPGIKT